MFRKLVSNLPFSPSLINQIGFYSKRLKKEQATRRIGLVLTSLAIIVQTLTIVSPAKPTLAASANDIIFGGGNLAETQRIYSSGCDSRGRCDIKAIFNAYGINADNLSRAKSENIFSSTANNYWSIGRAPRGTGGEVERQIPGGPKVYSRTLSGWAVNHSWPALRVETAQGTRWILTDCGNIVTKETPPKPNTPPADVTITKSVDKPIVNKGEKVTFTLKVTNIGKGQAKNVLVYDNAPAGLTLQNEGLGSEPIKSPQRWETRKRFNMSPGQSYTYRIKAIAEKSGPTTLVNKACVDIFDANIYNNCDSVPVTVKQPCPIPGKEQYAIDDTKNCKTNPNLVIEKTSNVKDLKVNETFEYTLKVTNKGDVALPRVVVRDVAPEQLEFLEVKDPGQNIYRPVSNKRDFVSDTFSLARNQSVTFTLKAKVIAASSGQVINQACVLSVGTDTTAGSCDTTPITIVEMCPTNPRVTKDSSDCRPCPVEGKSNLNYDDPACKPCDQTKQDENGADISCLELSKKARNITQQLVDATTKPAAPGDMIEYTLSVRNVSKETRKAFVIEENIEDVLEYADLQDANGATFKENPVKLLSWSPVDIKPGETVVRTVLIKVKSVLPTTPASTSDPYSNDLKMTNIYGNTVQIGLPSNPLKTTEQVVNTLPKTGLGANIIISTVVLMSATYFFFRSKLMTKEVALVRQQFNYGASA